MRYFFLLLLLSFSLNAGQIEYFASKVAGYNVKGVKINLNDSHVQVKLGLAYDKVGRTESLSEIALRNNAKVAINGSFFDAYTSSELKNPDMSLIRKGRLIFKSNIGSVIGFNANNKPVIARVKYNLWGEVTDETAKVRKWHAYWINRKPTSNPCVTIFTSEWGSSVQYYGGSMIVVSAGKVTGIVSGSVNIPTDGFVINIMGDAKLLSYFSTGDKVTFSPQIELNGCEPGIWSEVVTGIGGGPQVLKNGITQFNPADELFSDPKILTRSGSRSAVGYTTDNKLILVTISGAKVSDIGTILKSLGCVDGMNLDGGASSGLWLNGKYIVTPGRLISNALCVSINN